MSPLSQDEQYERRQAMPALFLSTPHLSTLSLVVERYEPDDIELRLPFRIDLTNDKRTYHGGVLATMLDSAAGLAAWSNHDFDRGIRAATVSLGIQYIASSNKSDLICRGVTIRRVKELIFTQASATDVDGKLLATAMQTYRITS